MMDGNDERVCRVCRLSAPESGQELYQPCKCSGSIQHVHEDCLRDWLAISRGHKCELCKQPFRWQKGEWCWVVIGNASNEAESQQ